MRIKEVPQEIEKLVSNKYVLIGGAALIAVVGYLYLSNQNANAATSSTDTTGLSTIGYTPISTGGIADSGTGTSSSAASSGIDPTTAAAFALTSNQNDQNFQTAMASIQASANATIAQQTTALQIAQLGLQSAQYQASASVTDAFIKSGENLIAGSVQPLATGGLSVDLVQQVQGSNWYTKTLPKNSQILASMISQTATSSSIVSANNAAQPSSTGSSGSTSNVTPNTTTAQYSRSNLSSVINGSLVGSGGLSTFA